MSGALEAGLHAALTLGVVLSAPRGERTARWTMGVLWISACVGAAYLSQSAASAAVAWATALLPFLTSAFGRPLDAGRASGLLLFPAQSRLADAFEHGPLLPLALLLNGHLGALVASRWLSALDPETAAMARPWITGLALLAAAAYAALAYQETRPRRVLARLIAGQGALILAGLACGNAAAAAGALALWQTAAVASTMLVCVYAGLEARMGAALDRPGFLGLASSAPRLAVFFAAAAFALGDMPLTMGFPAAELLIRGLLEGGLMGLALPIISALNAYVAVRLFARLFWGRPDDASRNVPDALPRERWALTAALLFLLIGGLVPSAFLP